MHICHELCKYSLGIIQIVDKFRFCLFPAILQIYLLSVDTVFVGQNIRQQMCQFVKKYHLRRIYIFSGNCRFTLSLVE